MGSGAIKMASAYVDLRAPTGQLTRDYATARAQTQSFATASTAAMRSVEASTKRATRSVGESWAAAGAKTEAAARRMKGPALAAAAIGFAVGKLSITFDKEMRNVNSIAQLPERGLKKLESKVLGLAGKVAQAPKTLAAGLYDLVSSGFNASQSMVVLKASATAATAGLTTTEVSTKAVAAVLNAYRLPAQKAKSVSDTLFQTVNRGVITFGELANTIGDVLPFAASLEVNLREVGGAISTMTKEGIGAPETMTRIKQVMVTMLKPGKALSKTIKELGYESGDAMIRQLGFLGTLRALSKEVHGQKPALAALFPNVRALGGVLALTGKNAKGAAKDLVGMRSDSGATAKALSQQSKSISYQWRQLRSEAEAFAIRVGGKMMPVLAELIHIGMGVVATFGHLPPVWQKLIIGAGILIAAMYPLLLIGGKLMTLWGGFLGLITKVELGLTGQAAASTRAAAANAELAASTTAAASAQRELLIANSSGVVTGSVPVGAPATVARGPVVAKYLNRGMTGAMIGTAGMAAGGAIGGPMGNLVSKASVGAGIGSMFGLPGAAVGAGVGAVVADVQLLFGAEKRLAPLQQKLAASSREVSKWFSAQRQASGALSQATHGVVEAHHREHAAAKAVKEADQHLAEQRQRFGPMSHQALKAEYELVQARHKQKQAADGVKQAEQKSGQALAYYKTVTRSAVAEERHRIHLLQERAARLRDVFKHEQVEGASQARLATIGKRGLHTLAALKDEQAKYSATLKDASQKAGPAFAHHMEHASTVMLAFGTRLDKFAPKLSRLGENAGPRKMAAAFEESTKRSGAMLQNLTSNAEGLARFSQKLPQVGLPWKHFAQVTGNSLGSTTKQIDRVKTHQHRLAESSPSDLQRVGAGYTGLATTSASALGSIGNNTNSLAKALGAPTIAFHLAGAGKVGKHAEGGKVTKPIAVMGEEAPRHHEWVVATNPAYRQRNLNYWAQAGADLGVPGFAKGGKHGGAGSLPHPHILGTMPMGGIGQAAADRSFRAAQKYLEAHTHAAGGGAMGPKGIGTYMGVTMANWVIEALRYAAAHGSGNPQPTSGYRPGFDPHAPSGSEHAKTQYPGGAVDFGGMVDPGSLPKKMAVVNATKGFKYPLLAPIGFRDDGHASGTGHRKGGILGVPDHRLARFATGGKFVATAYGPPWGGMQGTGVTATGIDLSSSPHKYIVAVDPSVIPLHSSLSINPNPFQTSEHFAAEDTGGAIKGNRLDFYDWRGRASQNAWGRRTVTVGGKGAGQKAETVPAVFDGARTKKLNFPGIPKTLHGVKREIAHRRAEVHHYRNSAAKAKHEGKPKTAKALEANVTALETRLKQLYRAKALLRRKAAQKKISRRLGRQLASLTGYEEVIASKQRAFEIAEQTATQIVDLEPLPPEGEFNADAEKAYVENLEGYVNGQERPAWEKVLVLAGDWRNTILGGETKATTMEIGWEHQIRKTEAEIAAINSYADKVHHDVSEWHHKHPGKPSPKWLNEEVKKEHELRAKLPVLRFRDRELRNVLGEGRGLFYGGIKGAVNPPVPPMPGTGSFEESLIGVQGIHWPDQHTPIAVLPPGRVAGQFGGAIWDTQTSIGELDLKIAGAKAGLGQGGPSSGQSEKEQLLEELLRQSNQRNLVDQFQKAALEGWDKLRQGIGRNFAGMFAAGGQIPAGMFGIVGERGPEIVHGPVGVTGAADSARILAGGGATKVEVVINGDIVQAPGDSRPAYEVKVNDVLQATGTGRKHPGAFAIRP